MKFTACLYLILCVLLLFLFCWTNIFRNISLDGCDIDNMINGNGFQLSIRRHKHFESKIHPLKSLYFPNKFASVILCINSECLKMHFFGARDHSSHLCFIKFMNDE